LDKISERLREAADESDYHLLAELTGRRHVSGVIAHLKGQTEKIDAFTGDRSIIHVANGVLELGDGTIRKYGFSPRYISRSLIPINYEPGAACPRFKDELLGLLNDEDRLLLQNSWACSCMDATLSKNF
jgi:phage/plasmid-associated DNA primase